MFRDDRHNLLCRFALGLDNVLDTMQAPESYQRCFPGELKTKALQRLGVTNVDPAMLFTATGLGKLMAVSGRGAQQFEIIRGHGIINNTGDNQIHGAVSMLTQGAAIPAAEPQPEAQAEPAAQPADSATGCDSQ